MVYDRWKEARDKRVEEAKKRQTVFSSYEWQHRMVEEVKGPALEGLMDILSSNYGRRLGGLLKLRRAMQAWVDFPEPTKENTWHPNSHRLIDIRDDFLSLCQLDEKHIRFIRLAINFIIVLYDYDPPYRMLIDWWAKKLGMTNWDYSIPITVVGHNWKWWLGEGAAAGSMYE